MKLDIMVVTHKNLSDINEPIPNDSEYIPMVVGPNKDNVSFSDFLRDDTGENIAAKNPNYCELTALYWAWKNLQDDYCGLVHYRRYFVTSFNKPIPTQTIKEYLKEVDVLLPKKRYHDGETNLELYSRRHYKKDLIETRSIIDEFYPEYTAAFDKVMNDKSLHSYNMMIMKKSVLDNYCSWLFDILEKLENRTDISGYDAHQARIYGFISERLLDVWLTTNNIQYKELPVRFLEKRSIVVRVNEQLNHLKNRMRNKKKGQANG